MIPKNTPRPDLDRISGLRGRVLRGVRKFGAPACRTCAGLGFVPRTVEVCACVSALCRCNRRAPFEIYAEEKRQVLPCPCQGVRVALERYRILLEASGIARRYRGKLLEAVELTESADVLPALEWATGLIESFAEDAPAPAPGGLYLVGGTGSGKTLIACAILNELMLFRQVRVLYAKISRDFLGSLRASFNPNSAAYGTGERVARRLQTVPVLVIDDLGIERRSEWVNETLYDLFDARWESELVTLVTSNEPMESWRGVYANRIYSRLRGSCREIRITTPDHRLSLAAH